MNAAQVPKAARAAALVGMGAPAPADFPDDFGKSGGV
jgi:hypothetical protein